MKTVRFYCFWVIGFLLVVRCTGKPAQRETTASEQPSQEQIPDQSEGWKIIEALSKAYGDDPTSARRTLEKVSGSKAFRIEMMTDSIFSEKQLKDLLDELNRRYNALPEGKLKANMMMWGSTFHFIEVTFIRNTPKARAEFRRLLMDSPAIRFSGPEEPIRNNVTGVSEVHGISLYPEYIVYADTASAASFILLNGSNEAITCGEHYFITYEGKNGQWYELPINTFAVDIAYYVAPGSSRQFVAG